MNIGKLWLDLDQCTIELNNTIQKLYEIKNEIDLEKKGDQQWSPNDHSDNIRHLIGRKHSTPPPRGERIIKKQRLTHPHQHTPNTWKRLERRNKYEKNDKKWIYS